MAYTIGDRTRKVTVYYIVNKKSKGGYLYSFLILREEIRTRNLLTITFFFEESSSSWLFIAMIYIITARITRYSMSTSYSSSSFLPNWKLIIDSVSPLKFIPINGTSILYQNLTLFSIIFVKFIFYLHLYKIIYFFLFHFEKIKNFPKKNMAYINTIFLFCLFFFIF